MNNDSLSTFTKEAKDISEVHCLILFGSRALEKETANSDIDIAFYSPNSINESKIREDLYLIATQCGIDKIDIVPINGRDRYLEHQIATYGKVLFKRSSFCLLYTSPSPRDATLSRMPSSA